MTRAHIAWAARAKRTIGPPGMLIATRGAGPPALRGAAGFDLVYSAEPGYRQMGRRLGLEESALERKLEALDRWTESSWVRRVYRVRWSHALTIGAL